MFFAQPSVCLAPYIKQYWGIENSSCATSAYSIKVVPHGLMELDFYLGNRPKIDNAGKDISENAIITGQQKQYYDIHINDKLDLFSVIFQPAGAMLFFDLPMNEAYNQNLPLRHFFMGSVERLEDELFEANSFSQRVQIMNSYLFEQLRKNHKSFAYARVFDSIQIVNHTKGLVEIDQLASSACLSRKQFERTFLACIGSTPKQFLRVVRFQHAVFNKGKNNDISLTELAHTCGYFDQSHMISEFKSLTGMTPKVYFAECEPVSDYFI